jgi:hypothetical protein
MGSEAFELGKAVGSAQRAVEEAEAAAAGACPTCGHSDFPKAKTLKPGKADQTPEAVPDLNAAIDKVEARLGGKRPGHWYTVFDVMNYLAYVATDEEIAGMVS